MGRVSRAEAGRILNVNRATIGRWVSKHPALLDEDGNVDPDELRAHRDAVINPANQTKARAAAGDTDKPSRKPPSDAPTLNDFRSRKESAAAIEAELDLAERLQLTLRRDQVEAAVSEAAETMKQKAGQLVRDRSEALSRIEDVRAMERALDTMMHELMASVADALDKSVKGGEGADAA